MLITFAGRLECVWLVLAGLLLTSYEGRIWGLSGAVVPSQSWGLARIVVSPEWCVISLPDRRTCLVVCNLSQSDPMFLAINRRTQRLDTQQWAKHKNLLELITFVYLIEASYTALYTR